MQRSQLGIGSSGSENLRRHDQTSLRD